MAELTDEEKQMINDITNSLNSTEREEIDNGEEKDDILHKYRINALHRVDKIFKQEEIKLGSYTTTNKELTNLTYGIHNHDGQKNMSTKIQEYIKNEYDWLFMFKFANYLR